MQATFTGYAVDYRKQSLYIFLSIVTVGLVPLLGWWLPELWLRLVCSPCEFHSATHVLVKVRTAADAGAGSDVEPAPAQLVALTHRQRNARQNCYDEVEVLPITAYASDDHDAELSAQGRAARRKQRPPTPSVRCHPSDGIGSRSRS